MDIQEREAFEKLPIIKDKLCWHIWFSEKDNKYDSYRDEAEEDRNFLNGAWMMYQEKFPPEGFVLVPKEPNDKITFSVLDDIFSCSFCYDDPSSWKMAYKKLINGVSKTVIEAQEQNNE